MGVTEVLSTRLTIGLVLKQGMYVTMHKYSQMCIYK